eukprot:m.282996 g.282996  ORF g.282996 m.282996 type:complete len:160 (+) comp54940_c1_seq2:621-1100(+)
MCPKEIWPGRLPMILLERETSPVSSPPLKNTSSSWPRLAHTPNQLFVNQRSKYRKRHRTLRAPVTSCWISRSVSLPAYFRIKRDFFCSWKGLADLLSLSGTSGAKECAPFAELGDVKCAPSTEASAGLASQHLQEQQPQEQPIPVMNLSLTDLDLDALE